jgi:uncharacterized membrane protein YsdA (DUF1294 family)
MEHYHHSIQRCGFKLLCLTSVVAIAICIAAYVATSSA